MLVSTVRKVVDKYKNGKNTSALKRDEDRGVV